MHIAWLGKKHPFCGNVTYSREITNALLDRGYQVSFLHFATDNADLEKWPVCEEVPLPCIYKSQGYTIPSLKSSKVLSQALQNLSPILFTHLLPSLPWIFCYPKFVRS